MFRPSRSPFVFAGAVLFGSFPLSSALCQVVRVPVGIVEAGGASGVMGAAEGGPVATVGAVPVLTGPSPLALGGILPGVSAVLSAGRPTVPVAVGARAVAAGGRVPAVASTMLGRQDAPAAAAAAAAAVRVGVSALAENVVSGLKVIEKPTASPDAVRAAGDDLFLNIKSPKPEVGAQVPDPGPGREARRTASLRRPGRNRTREYEGIWAQAGGAGGELVPLAELKNYKVLLVPGFLSGALIRLGASTWGNYLGRSRYFGEAMDWLGRLGVDHELVGIHTEQTSQHNAAVVARAVEASAKPVLIISHSKGCLDVLEMLLTREDLRAKVKGWLPVQGPFLGAPGADLALASRSLGKLNGFLLEWLGGSREALAAMTTVRARAYYTRNRKAIQRVLASIPTIAFASWRDWRLPRWMWLVNPGLKAAVDALAAFAGKTDGLVPAGSAALPGMDRVVVPEMDHFVPFAKTHRDFDRIRFVRTMLTMLLRRPA